MEVFIPLLVVLGVYILQYLFRGNEDNAKQQPNQKRGPAGPRTNPAKPRRQVSDLDRFLEETRKRKEQTQSKPVVVETADQPSLSDTAEKERKAAKEPRPRPAQPGRPPRERKNRALPPPAPEPVRPSLREQPAPVLLELAPPPSPAARVPPPVVPQALTPLPPPPAPVLLDRLGRPEAVAALAPSQRKATSPVVGELLRLLTKPQGPATAVILSEILNPPPSCRRS